MKTAPRMAPPAGVVEIVRLQREDFAYIKP